MLLFDSNSCNSLNLRIRIFPLNASNFDGQPVTKGKIFDDWRLNSSAVGSRFIAANSVEIQTFVIKRRLYRSGLM